MTVQQAVWPEATRRLGQPGLGTEGSGATCMQHVRLTLVKTKSRDQGSNGEVKVRQIPLEKCVHRHAGSSRAEGGNRKEPLKSQRGLGTGKWAGLRET